MKKIKLFFASLAMVALVLSCDDDGGTSVIKLDNGGVPDIDKVEASESFINLIEIQEGNDIDIGVTVNIGRGDVASIDLIGFYTKASTGESERYVFASNITTFPTTYAFTKAQLIDAFDVLATDADFELGDQLVFSGVVTLNNGMVLSLLTDEGTPNYGADIANSDEFSVVQTFTVSCPSDLAGTYSVVSSGSSTDAGPPPSSNPISNYPYTVTLTANGGGSYTISDTFGGLYILWYTMYGLDFEVPSTINDVCGTISGSFADPFQAGVNVTGVVNAEDGTITIDWVNDFGDQGHSVLTPN